MHFGGILVGVEHNFSMFNQLPYLAFLPNCKGESNKAKFKILAFLFKPFKTSPVSLQARICYNYPTTPNFDLISDFRYV
jgi:hypothetical protein